MPPKIHASLLCAAVTAALALPATIAQAQSETLQAKQAISLRDQPSSSAATLTTLAAGTSVTRTPQRSGPWMQVQTASGQLGWVHMFELTSANASAPASNGLTGALRGLSSFLNRGSNSGTTVATSTAGIRGLSKEDIQNAAPNTAALGQLDQLRADETQARRYASERTLVAQSIAALPVPTQAPSTNTARGNTP